MNCTLSDKIFTPGMWRVDIFLEKDQRGSMFIREEGEVCIVDVIQVNWKKMEFVKVAYSLKKQLSTLKSISVQNIFRKKL